MNFKKKHYPSNPFQVVLLFLFTIVLLSPLVLLSHQTVFLRFKYIDTLIGILFFLLIIAFSYYINWKRGFKLTFKVKCTNKLSILLYSIIIVSAFQFVVNPLINLGIHLMNHSQNQPINPLNNSIFDIISMILLAPIIEELVFRGIILKSFLLNYKPIKAILFSSILFGLIHFSSEKILGVFVLGVFFGWIYFKTNSLLFAIILHISENISGFISGFLKFNFNTSSLINWHNIYGNYTLYIYIFFLTSIYVCFKLLVKKLS